MPVVLASEVVAGGNWKTDGLLLSGLVSSVSMCWAVGWNKQISRPTFMRRT